MMAEAELFFAPLAPAPESLPAAVAELEVKAELPTDDFLDNPTWSEAGPTAAVSSCR